MRQKAGCLTVPLLCSGRPLSRASPLPHWIGCTRQELVGSQAAIAGKPAPTGIACSLQELVGCQAGSH